jgi:hypothetical protein
MRLTNNTRMNLYQPKSKVFFEIPVQLRLYAKKRHGIKKKWSYIPTPLAMMSIKNPIKESLICH